jgi:hypothetical protein
MKDKTKPRKLQPNGIVMADCFMSEWKTAGIEKRNPKTSNVMALWNQTANAKRLTPEQTEQVFNCVLEACLDVTSGTAEIVPNPN